MNIDSSQKRTLSNIIMLYALTIAKIIFPLLSLPYLTRVLSTDCYGVVSYVKSYITYVQLIVDFGFILSSVKEIVQAEGDKKEIGVIVGQTFFSKIFLSFLSLVLTVLMCNNVPILKEYTRYTLLSFIVVFLSSFLADFLFRGIEKMHYISIVFVIMKGISTTLTFFCVKSDSDILWIPLLDIISSIIAISVTLYIIIFRLTIKIKVVSVKRSLLMLKDSFFYFISNMATTAFGALNTLMIGILITDLAEVAYWSVCSSIVAAIQSIYTPITNGVYPYMIRNKNLKYIHRILKIVMPVLFLGATIGFFTSKTVLLIVGGEKYVGAYRLLQCFIPLLLISFPSMLYGWPTLGAIGKEKETSFTTLIAAGVQTMGLFVLIIFNRFTLINIALLRTVTEFVLFGQRCFLTYKNRNEFDIV